MQDAMQSAEIPELIQYGLASLQQGQLSQAKVIYERVLQQQPRNIDALNLLGIIEAQTNNHQFALELMDRAIEVNANSPGTYSNRGLALKSLKRLDEALASFDRAIAIQPDHAEAHFNRGILNTELKRFEEALADFDRAVAGRPDYPEAHGHRGVALQQLKRSEEALSSFDKAISLKPDFADAFNHRGFVLQTLNRLDEALLNYEKAIAVKADHAGAHWNLSTCQLLLGNFTAGWKGHEWRFKAGYAKRDFSSPLWLGADSLAGKKILLHADLNLGDTIIFCRYARLVASLGAEVILEVQPGLVELLNGLEGVGCIVARGDKLPKFDFHCPLLSLPLAFKTDATTTPSLPRYINADKQKAAKWQEKLGATTKPRIGIVWSSTSSFENDHIRSMSFAEFMKCLPEELNAYEIVCLQKVLKDTDKDLFHSQGHIRFFGDELKDFSDTAALIDCLDLVVSTCTSVPHLACALGKETWVILGHSNFWLWQLDRVDSPWYPPAKLYRQEKIKDWDCVLERVRVDLQQLHRRI